MGLLWLWDFYVLAQNPFNLYRSFLFARISHFR
jgi:hypothetical protein